jgi:hypothetical protein
LRARNKAGAQTTAPAFDDSEDWQRRGASYDVSNGANTADIRAVNAEATARTGAYWGFQYELGAFPTSLIESAGADTTRALDDLEVDVTGNPILTEGFTIHIRPSFSSAEQASHAAFQRILSTQNLHYLRFSSTPGIMQIAGDLGLVGVTGLSYSARQDLTITVDFVAGELTLAGFTTGDGVTDISAAGDWSGGTTMQVGNIGGLSQPYFGLITEPYALR